MRIVHVITRLILGGAQENTLYNVEDLQETYGDDVLLVTGPAEGPEGDLFERARQKNVRVHLTSRLRRAIDPWNDGLAYFELKRIIRDFRADVVHTHSSKAGIIGRGAAWSVKTPAVIHTVHGLPFHPFEKPLKNRLYIRAEKWAAHRCHRIISVADAMTRQALAVGIGRPEQYVTIYSGMEIEPFLQAERLRHQVRSELGLRPDDVVVMKIARLFEFKGHDDVIDAARHITASLPSLRFVFVGGGIWEERLKARIEEVGLSDRFVFTGLVPSSRIPELLSAADIVVHASYREGLARVLPQALLSAKPVISYDVDGAPEVVLPDRTGCLVKAGDIFGLAGAIRELAIDPDKRKRFGELGREHCRTRFDHRAMTRQIRSVYEDVLNESLVVQ
ncbi:glycosyltransferase family 4 protein [bacterium]|nr:glycosyltransferase family 4 protein [bacterium]